MGRSYLVRRPDPGQVPYHNHPAFLAYGTLTGIKAGETFNALQPGSRRFLVFYQGVNIRFLLRNKVQFKGRMIINTEVPDLHKECWQDMQGKASQEKVFGLIFLCIINSSYGTPAAYPPGAIPDRSRQASGFQFVWLVEKVNSLCDVFVTLMFLPVYHKEKPAKIGKMNVNSD